MKPEFVKIDDKKYKINTDFRIALECDEIARDESIGEYEKALAVIYKLFGDEGLNDRNNHGKLLELALKYLLQGEEKQSDVDDKNMDFEQDKGRIKASFFTDYKIADVFSVEYMHWWDFCDYLNGLTENCVLNRVRYIRDYDINDIKDTKERNKMIKTKESVALKKKERVLTEKEKSAHDRFMELAKLK